MRKKLALALTLDTAMSGCLLAGLAYPLTGNSLHEALGLMFVVLCGVHTLLNRKWYTSILCTKHSLRQKCNTVVTVLLSALMLAFIGSSALQSQTIFPVFIDVQTLETRKLHTVLAWWLFVLAGVHVGLHWHVVTSAVRQWAGISCRAARLMRLAAVPVALYGCAAFWERNMAAKLVGLHSFEYWDFDNAVGMYFAGYAAMLGCIILIIHSALRLYRQYKG